MRGAISPLIFGASAGKLLQRFPRPVLAYNWTKYGEMCNTLFNWKPEVVHSVVDIVGGPNTPPALNVVARSVTGGDFCSRGGNFNDTAIPSSVALRHRSMRAAMIYEFVVKGKKLRPSSARDLVSDQRSRAKRGGSNERGGPSRDFGKRFRPDRR